jgi:hypothetical protein
MPTIKNIGKQQRMVVDRFLQPGDSRFISAKRVSGFVGDPDFEIVDETPGLDTPVSTPATRPPETTLLKVQVEVIEPEVDPIDQRLVDAELKLEPIPTAKPKAEKSRGKKK